MEENKKWIVGVIAAVLFIICMALVIVGQRSISASGLIKQLVGLCGILAMLFAYNQKYK